MQYCLSVNCHRVNGAIDAIDVMTMA